MKAQALRELQGTTTLLVETSTMNLTNVVRCEQFNDIHKLYRVMSYVVRAVHKFKALIKKSTETTNLTGNISADEIAYSENLWIKEVQN